MAKLPWTAGTAPPPTSGSVTVLVSELRLDRWRDLPGFFATAMRVRGQVRAAEGAIGLALDAKPFDRTFRTLSAWRSQDDMDRFVGAEPHAASMGHFAPRLDRSVFRTYSLDAGELPPDWEGALTVLRAERPT